MNGAKAPTVLGIDTTGRYCQAGLAFGHSDRPVVISEEIGTGHAERLMGMIGSVLDSSNTAYGDLDFICACTGPGSFAGVRCGVSVAQGLSLALDIPAMGLNALDTLEPASTNNPVAVIVDARRDQFYWQCKAFDVPPQLASGDQIIKTIGERSVTLCGSGALTLSKLMPGSEKGNPLHTSSVADIARLLELAHGRISSGEKFPPPQPLYLREPDAKPQTGFALQRGG